MNENAKQLAALLGEECQSCNGYGRKTIKSELGETELRIPRDRNGAFEPQLIEKRQTRTEDLENRVMAMYANKKALPARSPRNYRVWEHKIRPSSSACQPDTGSPARGSAENIV